MTLDGRKYLVCVVYGGPEFDSQMMRELTHKYGFKWNSSSPEMPNSNGIMESAVKQIKYIIRKCNNENRDPCLVTLEFTNTPSKSTRNVPSTEILWKTIKKSTAYNEEISIPI